MPSFQEQMAVQTLSSSRILLAARSPLLLVPLPSALVGAGHDQLLHNGKPDSHFSRSKAGMSSNIHWYKKDQTEGLLLLEWAGESSLTFAKIHSDWYGGRRAQHEFYAWLTASGNDMGKTTPNSTWGLFHLLQPAPWCVGWDWCGLAMHRGEKGTHVPVSGKGILCSSMSHGAVD